MYGLGKHLKNYGAFLIVLLLSLGLSAPAAAEKEASIYGKTYPGRSSAGASAVRGDVEWGVINLGEDLFFSEDVELGGEAGYRRIEFALPREWEVLSGSYFEMNLSHSPSLIGELSSMSIRVNGKVIFSMKLDEININTKTYKVEIPQGILKEYNSMELIAYQHYMIECEDPFDPTLWTRIDRESSIHIRYRQTAPRIDLADLPYPLFEERGYGKARLNYLVPQAPSSTTLDAMAKIQVAMGRWIRWRETDINVSTNVPESLEDHNILIGTPNENPSIMAFSDLPPALALPLPLNGSIGFTTPDGSPIPKDRGVIIFTNHPNAPNHALLFITGNSPKGVALAAMALTQLPYEKSITGQALVVTKVDPRPKVEERANPTYIPNKDSFTLEEMGFDDITVRGFYASPIPFNLNMEPDNHPAIGRQAVKIVYSYGAQLQKSLSTLEVVLNGVSIGSKNLDNPEGIQHGELLVHIPESLLAPSNRLVVQFYLYPDNYFICGRVGDRHLWATLHKTSVITMPRDQYTELPDLSFLRYDWYPYTLFQDLQNTTIVLKDQTTAKDFQAMMVIADELGKRTHSEGIYLKAVTLKNLSQETKASDHLILIDTSARGATVKALVGDTSLYYNESNQRVMKTMQDQQFKVVEFKSAGVIEQINSPFNEKRTILIIRGPSDNAREDVLRALSDRGKLSELEYNLAFAFDTEDNVKSMQTSEAKIIGEKPKGEEARTWVFLNFWQTALLIIALIILIYIIASIIRLIRQRRRIQTVRRSRQRDVKRRG